MGADYNELLHMGGEGPGQFLQLQLGCGLHGRFSERRPYVLEGKNFPFHLYNTTLRARKMLSSHSCSGRKGTRMKLIGFYHIVLISMGDVHIMRKGWETG